MFQISFTLFCYLTAILINYQHEFIYVHCAVAGDF